MSKCDVAERCDGATVACPDDAFVTDSSAVCRDAVGFCDRLETCTGTSRHCPGDEFYGANVKCRASAPGAACDVPEYCSQSSPFCPSTDALRSDNVVCRAKSAESASCDSIDYCDGLNKHCTRDIFEPNGASCEDQDPMCTFADECIARRCSGNYVCSCDTDAKCDDNNECTLDTCNVNATCIYTNLNASHACDDLDACTVDGKCQGDGTCAGALSVDGDGVCPSGCAAHGACCASTCVCNDTAYAGHACSVLLDPTGGFHDWHSDVNGSRPDNDTSLVLLPLWNATRDAAQAVQILDAGSNYRVVAVAIAAGGSAFVSERGPLGVSGGDARRDAASRIDGAEANKEQLLFLFPFDFFVYGLRISSDVFDNDAVRVRVYYDADPIFSDENGQFLDADDFWDDPSAYLNISNVRVSIASKYSDVSVRLNRAQQTVDWRWTGVQARVVQVLYEAGNGARVADFAYQRPAASLQRPAREPIAPSEPTDDSASALTMALVILLLVAICAAAIVGSAYAGLKWPRVQQERLRAASKTHGRRNQQRPRSSEHD